MAKVLLSDFPDDPILDHNGMIGKFLIAALDLEDRMSNKVLNAYLNRDSWPANLTDEAFNKIIKILEPVIEDTERHSIIFNFIKRKLHESS
ncbi:MAG: hypothetical protein WCT08_05235 [Patescibacteria group bacterium]|jgi:hypothetical protein